MFSSIGIIYQHATTQGEEEAALGVDNWQVLLNSADESSQQGLMDIEALKLIRTILDRLWSSGSEEDLVNAARLLADRSRESK